MPGSERHNCVRNNRTTSIVGCSRSNESLNHYNRLPHQVRLLRLLRRCRVALDQVPHASEERNVVDDVEQPASTVLAALAFRRPERALLVHIAENGIRMNTGGDSDFGVIPFWFSHPFEA